MKAPVTACLLVSVGLLLLFAASLPAIARGADGSSSVGIGPGRVTEITGALPRPDAVYAENCDGTFENGYAWWAEGTGDPYFGAFAERFDVGPGEVVGIRLYLTGTGYYDPANTEDLFVWGRGVGGEPGAVLGMLPGAAVDRPAVWPNVSAHDFEISASVGSTFYVGGQANWPPCSHVYWFNVVDLDGPGGGPWTCVLPGQQYPEGWQDVDAVWSENARSMGIGVYYESGTSSVPIGPPQHRLSSWGRVKETFGGR